MRQANESPLPDGVKFHIWPRYVLSVDDVEVRLSRYRAEILLLLMSKPGVLFMARDVARAIYQFRNDGGALTPSDIVPTQILRLLRDCRAAGIDLRVKKPGAYQGYAFMGVGLVGQPMRGAENPTATAEARPKTAADMAVRVSRRIQQDADAGKPPGGSRKPKTGLAVIRHPSTDGWAFPERYERRHQRQREKGEAE